MRILLAPARQVRTDGPPGRTTPLFLDQAAELARHLAARNVWELESILRCSPQLAIGAAQAYQHFDPAATGSAALTSYWGLCYRALGARDFTGPELDWAQAHLRTVSALYGLLRPLDGIQPYRLEFLSRLRWQGQTLYRLWGSRIADALYADCGTVVNLAAEEYARAVRRHPGPGRRFIDCVFLPFPGAGRTVGATHAKLARGAMARFAAKNRVTKPEELQQFREGGFRFVPAASGPARWVFAREL